ncbi:protoporphyrinogen oxidase [Halanaeroarchaeum sulfurireducens]|uniref:Protoporphyrinogen oxidase n=1 Tax=Halanaeroarchaeum sulfurireducens TaxID=1604004 RepID=A0A0F7P9M9_9EURY|nr:protoporphyrinogen oxidase [Halanaeroarchaeum sulfurireducens]AKH97487.1 protoporphyrinogen oxidase [Halanaeroarchaeum sulfurireducens]ALG81883.1 protoporphyrinogen oxidase [Halanaeroarchaeum sulfurireducens]
MQNGDDITDEVGTQSAHSGPTVGVVGAGLSGLSATHSLASMEADVRTFEAAGRPGGVVRSTTIDDTVLEHGPQRLRLSAPLKSLVEELDLTEELRFGHEDQPLYAFYKGSLRPMPLSIRHAITTDLLSWRGKARILAEPLTESARPDETVHEYLARKFGTEAATRFMGPLYSGLYGTDPDEMYVEYSLGRALDHMGIEGSILLTVAKRLLEGIDTPPIVTFERGVKTLPDAMYDANADRIALDTAVTGIEQDGERFRIVSEAGTHTVDSVVLTTPAPTAADLLAGIDEPAADVLARFNYNPIGVVHLESDFDGEGHGFHVIDDGYVTNGSTWNHSMLDRDGIYTSYVGSGDETVLDAPDAEIGRRAAAEFEEITGTSAEVLSVNVIRPGMPAYDRSWSALDNLSLPDGITICSSYTSRAGVIGRIVDGRRTAKQVVSKSAGRH